MALNDTKGFDDVALKLGAGDFNFTSDVLKVALISDAYSSVDTTLSNQTLASFTEVSGGTYAAKTLSSVTWTRSGAVATLDAADLTGASQWAIDASGPTDIRCALFYDETAGNAALMVVDLTADAGVTPVSLQSDAVAITLNASGILSVTRS